MAPPSRRARASSRAAGAARRRRATLGCARHAATSSASPTTTALPSRDWARRLAAACADGGAAAGTTVADSAAGPAAAAAQLLTNTLMLSTRSANGATLGFAPTCNLACHAATLRTLPFDEAFSLAAGEDRDWCARLVAGGGLLRHVPEAIVVHHPQLGLGGLVRQQLRYGRGAVGFRAAGGALAGGGFYRASRARDGRGRPARRGLRRARAGVGRGRRGASARRAATRPLARRLRRRRRRPPWRRHRPAAANPRPGAGRVRGGVRAGRDDGPGVAGRVVARAPAAGAAAQHVAEARRVHAGQRRRRPLAPLHDEVGELVGARAGVVLGDAVDARDGGRAVGIGERGQAGGDRGQQRVGLGRVDDPVALAAAQVQADVALVVGGVTERRGLRPVDPAQLQARGQLERDAVGQRLRDRAARAGRDRRPQAPDRAGAAAVAGTAAGRRAARPRASAAAGRRASC